MKNLKIKKLLALAIAGVLSVGLVACGSSDADGAKTDAAAGSEDSASGTYRTLDDIKEDGTINIGVFSDKNPFAMWMKMENIKAMMYTSQIVWQKI